ncbi:hypothetical protein BH23BAC1_BH23BAC1_05510 [soil metagenome]
MTANGITHVYFLNRDTYLEYSLSFSGNKISYFSDSLDNKYNKFLKYEDEFVNTAFRFSTLINQKLSARGTLRTGIIASRLGFNVYAKGENEEKTALEEFVNNQGNTMLVQAYSQYKHRLTEQLTLSGGVHSMYLTLNNNFSLEPRAGLKWNFLPKQSLSAGMGLHSRIESMSNYFSQQTLADGQVVRPNQNLDFMKAWHYVLAYDRKFWEDLHLRMEIYYQQLNNVPIAPVGVTDPRLRSFSALNFDSGFTTDSLVNEGKGRNYGVEITLEKYFTRNYYFYGQ